jgi:hypothetical protein
MKKFFAMLVVAAMLASLCALSASAVEESEWNAFGEVTAKYDADLSNKITLDGDVSDWQNGGFTRYDIDKYNLDPWLGEVDENWSINLWFSADAQYLYIAFKINDKTVLPSDDGLYNGDAFQIQLDFNGWAAETENFERAVFYSFGLQEDNTVDMTVQCIYGDAASTIDYTMASDDDPEFREGEVKGATKAAEDGSGWYAEFAISWQTLYNDISNKLLNDELPVPEWTGGEDKVSLNMLICYLDHNVTEDGSDAGIVGAWGTSHALGSLGGGDGWYPESAGMTLTLDGMVEVTIESTEAPTETEAETDAETEAKTDAETEAKTDAETNAPDGEQTTEPAAEKEKSCGGVIGAGVIVAVLAMGACVVAKKKD